MKRILTLIAVLLTAAAFTAQWTSEATAQQPQTTYVSRSGTNGNDCLTPTTACPSFAAALNATVDYGAIQCLDAGDFGVASITKSVTIDCLAGGRACNCAYFVINAPGKTVVLRNVAMNALSQSFYLIEILAAADVYIENVTVGGSGLGRPGIYDNRAGPGGLVIRNSSIVGNTGVGILVAPSSGTIGVELDNVSSAYNTYGLAVGRGGRVMIKNSVFAYNKTAGIEADGGAFVGISSSEISFNSTGISSGGTVSLQNSSVASNTTAIQGATQSLGNNRLFANSTNGTPPTIVSGQ